MAAQEPPYSKQYSILVVEDEGMIAMDLQDLLEEGGYQVLGPVASVRAAISLLDQITADACVLDVNLRGEVSAPVAKRLKERGVPFLLSSAYKQDTLKDHAEFHGVINIGKPASPERLLSVIASLLARETNDASPATP